MKILVDTNVIIDIFTKREPWFKNSYKSLSIAVETDTNELFISASCIADIFYLLRKSLKDKDKTKSCIERLSRLCTIADATSTDIQTALNSEMDDFEDAVVDSVAHRHGADYILTRNVKDFTDSLVKAITPDEFIKDHYPAS